MKKIIAIFTSTALAIAARGQGYSTNLFYLNNYVTNIYQGTNATDPARDTYHEIWCKINANNRVLDERSKTNALAIASLNTNPAFTNPVATPFIALTPYTVMASTNSTFGYGAGLLAADTNYLYLTVGTNLWKRVALTSW